MAGGAGLLVRKSVNEFFQAMIVATNCLKAFACEHCKPTQVFVNDKSIRLSVSSATEQSSLGLDACSAKHPSPDYIDRTVDNRTGSQNSNGQRYYVNCVPATFVIRSFELIHLL